MPQLFQRALLGLAVLVLSVAVGSASAHSLAVPTNTSPPTISGSPSVGATLSATTGTWTGSPTSYAYQWQRCGYAAVVLHDSPAGYWRLDESSGTTLANSVSGGSAATLSGVYTLGQTGATGDGDAAILFNGGDGQVPSYSGINTPSGSVSIEWWYKGSIPAQAKWMIAKATSTNADPWLQYAVGADANNQVKVDLRTNPQFASNVWSTGVAWPADSNWHYFAVTYNSSSGSARLYIDGTQRASTTRSGGQIGSAGGVLNFMHSQWAGAGSSGTISGRLDDVSIYSTVLSGTQVSAHWAAATGTGCYAIAGATSSTYTVTSADLGATLRVTVTATNGSGSSSPAPSSTVGPVTAPTGAPVNTAPPTISGTAQWGQTLTVDPGTWTGDQPIDYSYQWQHCSTSTCWNSAGATGTSYTLGLQDVTRTVKVIVTATNASGNGTASATSSTVTVDATRANERVQQFDAATESGSGWAGQNTTSSPATHSVMNAFGWQSGSVSDGIGGAGGSFGQGTSLAYYAERLAPVDETSTFTAHGHFKVDGDSGGGVVIGFFNSSASHWWRTADTLGVRIFHDDGVIKACLEAGSSNWAATFMDPNHCQTATAQCANADQWQAIQLDNRYSWDLSYDPAGDGSMTLKIQNLDANTDLGSCTLALSPQAHSDGFVFDRLGITPLMSIATSASMTAYIDDVSFNGGAEQSFATDPTGPNIGQWELLGPTNTTYSDPTRPPDQSTSFAGYDSVRWSPTNHASGESNEAGGTLWRPDAYVTNAGATFYADSVGPLNLDEPLHAEGYVSLTYANSDSGSLFGWFNPSTLSGQEYPHNFVGFAVEGHSVVGYPVRAIVSPASGSASYVDGGSTAAPRLDPDGTGHYFTIDYVPNADGTGTLTVTLDGVSDVAVISVAQRSSGATLTRFGISQYSDTANGPAQTIFYDSLAYTAS